VTTAFNPSSVTGELAEFDPVTGKQVGAVILPPDPANNFFYYPYGFSIAADGTFWVSQPNSENIIHVDAKGNLLSSFSTAGVLPESATVRPDGNVYFAGYGSNSATTGIYLLSPSLGTYALFATQPSPDMTQVAATGGVWSGDFFDGAQRFDTGGNLKQTVGYFGAIAAQTDPSGNVWNSNFAYGDLFRFDPSGNQQIAAAAPGALGLSVWGVDNPTPPAADTQDFYSFALSAGQSATIAVESLNGMSAGIVLQDKNGNVLASGVGGSTNVSQSIQNFVAPSAGTYYIEVTGTSGVQYSLVVTRSANFDIEPHGTFYQAQPLTGTNGALGALDPGGTLTVGKNYEGVDFNGSNCGCLPPDTNAAVGGNYIVETVNVEIRVYDKTSGSILLDEPLSTFFGAASGGDVYVVYDSIASRWYVSAFNSGDSGLFLAVSKDANPLDGFLPTYNINNIGGAPDYPKPGYNKDAIFISFNDFSTTGQAKIVTINKADALSGTLVDFVSTPEFQFRAMPPAQLSGDTTGGTEWFVSTDGSDVSGNTMRVTEMTNYFSNSPTFTYTSLPVTAYQSSGIANQPGGTWTTFPNTTTTQVLEAANGELVTAMSSAVAADGFTYNKGLYYVVNISGGTPTLVKQGVVDPGAGVSVQMFTAAMDSRGDLGFTWMEGSSTEYVSMWVGALDTQGHFSSYDATPNAGFFNVSFRIGDYSTIVIDPTDGNTFWAANEYSGQDSATDIWRTHITSFSLPPAVNNDWYTINVGAGNTLTLQSYTPSTQGGQYPNADPVITIQLYDTFGNLVASGTTNVDGHNQTLTYKATIGGQYHILLSNKAGTSGEYFLKVSTPSYAAGAITGQVINDIKGNGKLTGDPGLDNWEVDVYQKKTKVASQMTHGGGNFDFEGLAPGTYTVQEVLQSGWTQTAPASGTFSATVTAGHVVSGLQFGDFQNITIAGLAYNDLNGDGAQESGEPGLSGWTVQLVNSAGKVVASQVTASSGAYSFANVGPGTYKVQEVLKSGWILTSSPTTFTVAATSGQNVGGLAFGDFQLVTYSGKVYNDTNGNGVIDSGEKALKGWTVNLLNSMGALVASYTTNGNGNYSFPNLGPGKWTLQEVNQSGWYQTQPVNPPGIYSFAAASGASQSGLNFGNFQEITLSGLVYNDLNGDGKKQGKEPGLANWTVELLNTSGNIVASTTTGSNGNYSIGGVFPGTFTLVEVLQSGWVQTQPVNPPAYTITPQSGQNQSGLIFGVHKTSAHSSALAVAAASASSTATPGAANGAIAVLGTTTGAAPDGPLSATASTTGASPAPATVSITATAPASTLRVVYNEGLQPVGNPTAPLVDVALGVVSSRLRARQATLTERAVSSLMGTLLDDGDDN
jgi:hypothetical protein